MIVFILLLHNADAAVNPYGPTVVKDFTNCITSLIERNFDSPGLLIFGNTKHVNPPVANIRAGILKRIHEKLNFSVQIATPSDKVEVCNGGPYEDGNLLHRDQFEPIPAADYFVIIVNTFEEFIYLASKVIRLRSWNPFAKFIIFLINFSYDEDKNIEYTEKILSCLFRYNVINVLVAVSQPGEIRNALLYSWMPYNPPKFCGYFNETAKGRLTLENTCERGVLKEEKYLFYDKVPNNMHKCVLDILAIERQPFLSKEDDDPNIEKFLLNKMFRTFNFTVQYNFVYEYRGERHESGEWSGALGILVAKRGHVLLGGIFPDFDVHEDFECSSQYLADSYAWVVPRAKPCPPWVALVIMFRSFVWYSIAVGFVVCVAAWQILGNMSDDTPYHKSFAHCLLNTCIVTLGFSAYVRPITSSLRMFFVFLNLYCILLSTAYQTKLIEVLQSPHSFENQVDTIEELVESGLKFGGTEELHDLFSDSNDSFDQIINEKWTDVEDISDALIDVAQYRNFSVLCSRLELAYLTAIMPELTDSNGRLRYYVFDLNTFSVPAEMIALRGFPFMRKFSTTLRGFKQLGMNEGVRRRFARFNKRKRAKLLLSMNVTSSNFSPLSILQLQGGFHVLILGIVSGSVVLIIEIIVDYKYVRDLFSRFR